METEKACFGGGIFPGGYTGHCSFASAHATLLWMAGAEDTAGVVASAALREAATAVVRRLRKAGFEALFAGGCVRDLQLGREPTDYDIATSARPDDVTALFARTVSVGARFGVILVVTETASFEVATFRSDGDYLDSRRPSQVTWSDARGDAERRDFTINGMFLDPLNGELLDYIGGRKDLDAGIIRAIGDPRARFGEDRLRLLRGVRFAARLGATIEPATFSAMQEMAPTITEIAWERIGDEIRKILAEGAAARGLDLLSESGLLAVILPEIEAMHGVEQPVKHHPEGDVFVHTRRCIGGLRPEHDASVRLATLLHDVAKPPCFTRDETGRIKFHGHCERGAEMARVICERLRCSNALRDKVVWLIANHLRHAEADQMRPATLKRFFAEEHFPALLELIRLDSLGGRGDLTRWEKLRAQYENLSAEELHPEPLLRGRDLLQLGYPEGPRLKIILEDALDAQLEGDLVDIGAARAWALHKHPLVGGGA
ncbi:MAG: CCA tRNA nucleotidyltransferase [Deltaproteobacteria bacterium]